MTQTVDNHAAPMHSIFNFVHSKTTNRAVDRQECSVFSCSKQRASLRASTPDPLFCIAVFPPYSPNSPQNRDALGSAHLLRVHDQVQAVGEAVWNKQEVPFPLHRAGCTQRQLRARLGNSNRLASKFDLRTAHHSCRDTHHTLLGLTSTRKPT